MMRPLPYLRWRWAGWGNALYQLWVNDDQTAWEWRMLDHLQVGEPMKGEGPPPIHGDQTKESSS